MAIKIRKKSDNAAAEQNKVVQEPEVLPPEGKESDDNLNNEQLHVQVPGMDDDFLRKSGTAMEWLLEHRRAVIGIAALAIVVAFAVIGSSRIQESAAESDSEILSKALTSYTASTKEEADKIEAQWAEQLKNAGIAAETTDTLHFQYTVPNNEVRYVGIAKYLSSELPKLGQKPVAESGQLMLGGAISHSQNAAEAKAAYDKAAASTNTNIALFGKLGQIESMTSQKQFDDALSLIDSLLANNDYASLNSYLTFEKARLCELKGDKDNAIKYYTDVLSMNRTIDEQLALAQLRVLTSDWSERYQNAQNAKNLAAQNAAAAQAQAAQ